MTTPGTGNLDRHDLYQIHHVVQNNFLSYPKELVIGILREEFSKDSYYHYAADPYGFPNIPDHTDLPREAGYFDDTTSRIFIGEAFRFNAIFYPAVLVRMTSAKYVPISMNQNKDVIEYEKQLVIDGYGNVKQFFTPRYIDLAGAWEGTITIDIFARDIMTRDDLCSFIMLLFASIRFETMRKAGVLVKAGQPSLGGMSESEDRQQEKLYKASISIEVRSEWRRLVPVDSVVDRINMCVDFGVVGQSGSENPNLQIRTEVDLLDQIDDL